MDIKVIVDFYKNQIYIFGICPCCKEIFHLPESCLSLPTKKIILSESRDVINLQRKNESFEMKIDEESQKIEEKQYEISELKLELKNKDNQQITRVKKQGRKEAINASRKVIPIFTKKKFDPRDARLIFSPVEFLVFDGLTEYREIDNLILLAKRPSTQEEEKLSKSIQMTIKNGNVDFQVIRFNKDGKIIYEKNAG